MYSGITLAMALLPEEFPVVLTVFLALGAWRISKINFNASFQPRYIRYFYDVDHITYHQHQLSSLNSLDNFRCAYYAYESSMIVNISEFEASAEQHICRFKHSQHNLCSMLGMRFSSV